MIARQARFDFFVLSCYLNDMKMCGLFSIMASVSVLDMCPLLMLLAPQRQATFMVCVVLVPELNFFYFSELLSNSVHF